MDNRQKESGNDNKRHRVKDKLIRADINFAEIILTEIPNNRIKNEVDNKHRTVQEITSKMIKHPLFAKLKEDLENFKFKDE